MTIFTVHHAIKKIALVVTSASTVINRTRQMGVAKDMNKHILKNLTVSFVIENLLKIIIKLSTKSDAVIVHGLSSIIANGAELIMPFKIVRFIRDATTLNSMIY